MKHTFLYFSLFTFCSFLSLSSPVYYFPCLLLSILLLSVFAYPLLSLYPSVFYPSPLIFFIYLQLSLSASISFFVFYFPSWISSTFFFCLPSFMFPLLFTLSLRVCVFCYYYCYSILLFSILYLSIFCLPFLVIFLHYFLFCLSFLVFFSTLFDYLVLILDFNYCKFSLLFIFSIFLRYLFPFSLAVFFTKFNFLSFCILAHAL